MIDFGILLKQLPTPPDLYLLPPLCAYEYKPLFVLERKQRMCKVRLKINRPPLPEPDRKALESLLCNCFHFKSRITSLSTK